MVGHLVLVQGIEVRVLVGQQISYTQKMNDEYLDLVNDNDEVIGKKLRSEIYEEHLSNFRTISVFLKNSEGKLWIPRRVAGKKIFPLCLDMSAAGHVESGETYEQSFKRELLEELNIDSEKISWKLLGRLTPKLNNTSCFISTYEIETDIPPTFNTDDYSEYYWLTPLELLQRIEKGENAKSDLSILVKHFYIN